MCYLKNILRRKFLELLCINIRFYFYDLKNGNALTVVSTTNVINLSKFEFIFFCNFERQGT
jgi:hypothetical protein